ncbi:MAG: IclR family transcriptional regulator [Pseudomonadota bacterium]
MPDDVAPVGSVARAARVLAALASHPGGVALADVVAQTGFTKTTAHRVLGSLQDVSYVSQDPETKTYRLGVRLAALSRAAATADLGSMSRRGLRRLAKATGDTVFLSIPEGAVSVCVAREVGDYPIRTLTLGEGDRRPLGVGAGALALYCAMSSKRRAAVNRVNRLWLTEYGFDAARLEAEVPLFGGRGYALNAGGVVSAMSAVGVPVLDRRGQPLAALAIGAINERMTPERIAELIYPQLKEEAARLGERMNDWSEESGA